MTLAVFYQGFFNPRIWQITRIALINVRAQRKRQGSSVNNVTAFSHIKREEIVEGVLGGLSKLGLRIG